MYKTTRAILYKGSRFEKKQIVDIPKEEAERYGDGLVPYIAETAAVSDEAEAEEQPVDDLSYEELKAKAEELGLKKSGSAADLRERIALALAGDEETEEEELSEEANKPE